MKRRTSYESNLRDAALLERIQAEVGLTFSVARAKEVIDITKLDLARMVNAGWILPAGRGFYTIARRPRPEGDDRLALATAPYQDQPHYVSWYSALAEHGFTDQDPLEIGVAVQDQLRRRKVGALTIRPVVQSRDRFYGFESRRTSSGKVRVASPEKAIIDSLDRPELGGGLPEVTRALSRTSLYDQAKLVQMAQRHPSAALAQRLGYLLSSLGIADPEPLHRLVRRKGPAVVLDLARGADERIQSTTDPEWRVLDNVGTDTLHSWVGR